MDDRYRHFHIADDAPEEMVQQYVRSQMLRLLDGVLLLDTSSNKMKLIFLSLLEDLDFAHRLSWGSAVLACLYRAMCWGSYADQSEIDGYLILLQVYELKIFIFNIQLYFTLGISCMIFLKFTDLDMRAYTDYQSITTTVARDAIRAA